MQLDLGLGVEFGLELAWVGLESGFRIKSKVELGWLGWAGIRVGLSWV